MVKILFLIPTLTLALYPFLDHLPFFLYGEGFVVLDSESPSEVPLLIRVKTPEDSFLIFDQPSKRHRLRIPITESFEYEISLGDLRRSGKVVFPSPSLEEASILIFGDSRGNPEVLREIVSLGSNADFLIFLGDIASFDFIDDEWRGFFEALSDFGKVVFAIKGNHEIPGLRFSEYLYPESYSFRIGGVNFIAVNPGILTDVSREIEQRLDPESFNVLLIHQPVVSCTEGSPAVNENLLRDLRDMKVSLVISSHDHNYQRIEMNGLVQLIFGGGGAPVYDVNENCRVLRSHYEGYSFSIMRIERGRISFEVFDLSGRILDSFEVGM